MTLFIKLKRAQHERDFFSSNAIRKQPRPNTSHKLTHHQVPVCNAVHARGTEIKHFFCL